MLTCCHNTIGLFMVTRCAYSILYYKFSTTDEVLLTAAPVSLTAIAADSGSNAPERKPSLSVRNGPLPPIPTLADPVSNSGHKQERQPPSNSLSRRGGSGNRKVEQPTATVAPQSPSLGRPARQDSQRDSRHHSQQEPPQDSRRDTWQEARQESRQNLLRQTPQPSPQRESQPDPRHNLQRGGSLSAGVGCYIHPNLAHEDVQKAFAPYLARNGSYLIRPSATTGKMTLCVT